MQARQDGYWVQELFHGENMISEHCNCDKEAEVLYKMYRTMGTLQDAEWVGESCCTDEPVTVIIKDHSVTIKYHDGTVSYYQHDVDSPMTFEKSTEPVDFYSDANIPVTRM